MVLRHQSIKISLLSLLPANHRKLSYSRRKVTGAFVYYHNNNSKKHAAKSKTAQQCKNSRSQHFNSKLCAPINKKKDVLQLITKLVITIFRTINN